MDEVWDRMEEKRIVMGVIKAYVEVNNKVEITRETPW